MENSPRISKAQSCVRIVRSQEANINSAIQSCVKESSEFQLAMGKDQLNRDYQCHQTQSIHQQGKTTTVALFTTCEGNMTDAILQSVFPDTYKAVVAERVQTKLYNDSITKIAANIEGLNKLLDGIYTLYSKWYGHQNYDDRPLEVRQQELEEMYRVRASNRHTATGLGHGM